MWKWSCPKCLYVYELHKLRKVGSRLYCPNCGEYAGTYKYLRTLIKKR